MQWAVISNKVGAEIRKARRCTVRLRCLMLTTLGTTQYLCHRKCCSTLVTSQKVLCTSLAHARRANACTTGNHAVLLHTLTQDQSSTVEHGIREPSAQKMEVIENQLHMKQCTQRSTAHAMGIHSRSVA